MSDSQSDSQIDQLKSDLQNYNPGDPIPNDFTTDDIIKLYVDNKLDVFLNKIVVITEKHKNQIIESPSLSQLEDDKRLPLISNLQANPTRIGALTAVITTQAIFLKVNVDAATVAQEIVNTVFGEGTDESRVMLAYNKRANQTISSYEYPGEEHQDGSGITES